MALLEVHDVKKSFVTPDGTRHTVIAIPHFSLEEKDQVALQGESGSGKTTFLNLIAGILKPDSGRISLAGKEVSKLAEPARDRLRATTIGYIFQTFNLLPAFTCLENVLLGMAFGPGTDRDFAEHLLVRIGLRDRLHYRPRQLSVGQQQRVAVARAVANRPKLVLADEPTGNLDSHHAAESLALIREMCADAGAALLLVSHDREVLTQFGTIHEFAVLNEGAGSNAGGVLQ